MDTGGFRLLYEYNSWANDAVVEKAAEAPEADYYAASEGLSFGSLHATLVHIFQGELVWFARWQGEKPPEPLKDARVADAVARTEVPALAKLRELWDVERAKQGFALFERAEALASDKDAFLSQWGVSWLNGLSKHRVAASAALIERVRASAIRKREALDPSDPYRWAREQEIALLLRVVDEA